MPVTRIKSVTSEVVDIAGLLVCERFEATIEIEDFRFDGVIDVSSGRPRLLSASIKYGDDGIRLADLGSRDTQVRRCLEQAFIDALAMTSWDPKLMVKGFSPESEGVWRRHGAAEDMGQPTGTRRPGRPQLSDEFLMAAVDTYINEGWKAVAKPDGTPATERTARRYMSVARERGLADWPAGRYPTTVDTRHVGASTRAVRSRPATSR